MQVTRVSILVGLVRATQHCMRNVACWVLKHAVRVRDCARESYSRSAPVTDEASTVRVTCDDTPVSRDSRSVYNISACVVSFKYYYLFNISIFHKVV